MTQPGRPVPNTAPRTFYDEVGGRRAFETIVDRFYEIATADPVLRPLLDRPDAGTVRRRITAFFVQYWGGPRDYARERGAPRLAFRHSAFRIGPAERDAYLRAMRQALQQAGLTAEQRVTFLEYLTNTVGRLMGPRA